MRGYAFLVVGLTAAALPLQFEKQAIALDVKELEIRKARPQPHALQFLGCRRSTLALDPHMAAILTGREMRPQPLDRAPSPQQVGERDMSQELARRRRPHAALALALEQRELARVHDGTITRPACAFSSPPG